LCDNILVETIGNESAVMLLNNVEDNLHVIASHDNDISQYALLGQGIPTAPQLMSRKLEGKVCIATNWTRPTWPAGSPSACGAAS
jgi:hypothetical protein